MAKNKHGLEYHMVANWLRGVLGDIDHSTPKECARELVKIAAIADKEATIVAAHELEVETVPCTHDVKDPK